MLELAMHILDIAENSTRAGASLITIRIIEDHKKDMLTIEISDNGKGMNQDECNKALDPFYTSKKVRRVGLGLPLLHEATKRCEGSFSLESGKDKGTCVQAGFTYNHIDRQPLGNMPSTLLTLIAGNPDVDFIYSHQKNNAVYTLDTRIIRKEIEGIPMNNPEILRFVRGHIEDGLNEIGANR